MKNLYVLFLLFFTLFAFGQKNKNTIGFIENKGQIVDQKGKSNPTVQYLLNTPGLNVQLRSHGFSYDIYETKKIPLGKKQKAIRRSTFDKDIPALDSTFEYNYHRIDIDFLNSKSDVQIISDEKSTDYDNYYNVAHAPGGITNVHKFQKVTYQNIYNNIDLVFFIPEDVSKAVEYNFVVKPGGKISDIQLQFKGAETELADNKIKMNVRFGQIEETLPLSWIENGNDRKEIAVGYKQIKKGIYGFEGDVNVSGKTIVIDPTPVRLWGTYYGGEKFESLYCIENDNQGNAYICGSTTSANFIATFGAHQSTIGSNNNVDGYIAKFDSNGNRQWSTYYGGSLEDKIMDVAINSNNLLAFCGNTRSDNNIASPGAFKTNKTGANTNIEMFFGILDTNGQRQWATYFGDDQGSSSMNSIVFDSNNNLYIGGTTNSLSFIATANGFNNITPNSVVNYKGFVSKFSLNGNQIWGTYYGANTSQSNINDLAIDSNNNIIAVGYTYSTSGISTQNSYQQLLNNTGVNSLNTDGFIVSFNSAGTRNWGTYFGSSEKDVIKKIKYLNNAIYLSGSSNSIDLATPNAFLTTNNIYNSLSFIAKYDIVNHQKTWFSYSEPDILDFDINQNGEIILVGNHAHYYRDNIATPCSYIVNGNTNGSYMRKIDNNCQIIWGSFLSIYPNSKNPFISCIDNNLFYVAGEFTTPNAQYNDMTTPNSYQEFSNGQREIYINKFQDILGVNTTPSNLNVCIGSSLNLTAPTSISYLWTGPNGFTSTDQNPVITNTNTSNSGQYSCTITQSGGCIYTLTTNVIIGDNTAPIPTIQNLSAINGDCITIILIPTATDNCAGIINATTTDPLSYSTAGNYTIHWNYNDGNGNTSTQNQSVVISATALPIATSPQNFCIQDNATLNTIAITGQNIQWYDALTLGNLLPTTTVLQNGVTYYASQTINGCESSRVSITINVQNTPIPTGDQNPSFCTTQNPTLVDVIVIGSGIKWYSNAISTSVLPMTTVLVNGTTYYATQTVNGCESINRLPVTVTLINTLNATNYSESLCDDLNDGTQTVDLTTYNSKLISNTAGCTFSYYSSWTGAENQNTSEQISNNYTLPLGLKTIYVRIESSNGCHQIVELQLTLVKKPVITISDIMPICEGSSITLDAGLGYHGYLWSTNETTSSIVISTPGNYSVSVDEVHGTLTCSSVKNFSVVKSNIATISEVITSDWTDNENTITAMLTGSSVGDYVYSLDGITYQSSNTFSGLESGEYTVFVKDKNGCGIQSEEFYLLMYPKFFTPNGDGFNDTWQIKFSDNEPRLKVQLFDRFGKFIKELDNTNGWNGTFNNQELPATDYWFVVTRANGKEYKGHFAMKR